MLSDFCQTYLQYLETHLPDLSFAPGLYLVGTPLGNLLDASPRSLVSLLNMDYIAAEDTRLTKRLLQTYGLSLSNLRFISYHAHNLKQREAEITEILASGQKLALVSDAGLPAISDPGQELLALAHEKDFPVHLVPGPSAGPSALAASGFPSENAIFRGFLASKASARTAELQAISQTPTTQVIYEAPHRLVSLLEALQELGCGQRPCFIAREMTKRYEELRQASVADLVDYYAHTKPRGEFVVVLGPLSKDEQAASQAEEASCKLDAWTQLVHLALSKGASTKDVLQALEPHLSLKKNELKTWLSQQKELIED